MNKLVEKTLMDYDDILYSEIQNTLDKYKSFNQQKIHYLALKYFKEKCELAKYFLSNAYDIVCDQEKANKCGAMYFYNDILKNRKVGETIYCGLDKHNNIFFRNG
jgi:hypothetical protein